MPIHRNSYYDIKNVVFSLTKDCNRLVNSYFVFAQMNFIFLFLREAQQSFKKAWKTAQYPAALMRKLN